jgi:hypothetical protein
VLLPVLVANSALALSWDFRQEAYAMIIVSSLHPCVFVSQDTQGRLNGGHVFREGLELFKVCLFKFLGIAFAKGLYGCKANGVGKNNGNFLKECSIPGQGRIYDGRKHTGHCGSVRVCEKALFAFVPGQRRIVFEVLDKC